VTVTVTVTVTVMGDTSLYMYCMTLSATTIFSMQCSVYAVYAGAGHFECPTLGNLPQLFNAVSNLLQTMRGARTQGGGLWAKSPARRMQS
jgi:hypothetical protein